MNSRIESLDWLRGLMAISIMVYHLVSWLFGSLDAGGLLGRLGIYGVSIFFILSGLSMGIVYSKYIDDSRTSVFFFIRRVFRIWPLLWICVALAIVPVIASGGNVSVFQVLANITTLFGFIKPEAYINTGAWSIGNEMVYYALTPVIILLYRKSRLYGNLFFLLSFVVGVVFSFVLLQADTGLSEQWKVYINPFNNLFLYVSGLAIYFNFHEVKINHFATSTLLISSVIFFAFYPATGNQVQIVTGMNRLLFAVASMVLVFSFYKFSWYEHTPRFISFPLEQFGIATYGVYLLHPLVNLYLDFMLRKLGISDPYLQSILVVILTILFALLSYNLVEKKLMASGKKLTATEGKFLSFLKKKSRPTSSST